MRKELKFASELLAYKTSESVLKSPLHVFASDQDDSAPFSSMICWQKYTKNRFALSCFLGNHFFVRDSNNIARIVKKITNKAEG